MHGILAVVATHGADELAFLDEIVQFHEALVQMRVKTVHHGDAAVCFAKHVPHEDAVSPADADVLGENDDAAPDGVNGVAEVGIAAAVAIPILAHVAVGPVTARFVVTVGVRFAAGKVKTVRQSHANGGAGLSAAFDHGRAPRRHDEQAAGERREAEKGRKSGDHAGSGRSRYSREAPKGQREKPASGRGAAEPANQPNWGRRSTTLVLAMKSCSVRLSERKIMTQSTMP